MAKKVALDVYCAGCGGYCYSKRKKDVVESAESEAAPESAWYYCGVCQDALERNVRTKDMINHEWHLRFRQAHEQYENVRGTISSKKHEVIRTFGETVRRWYPEDFPKEISVAEGDMEMERETWKLFSFQKLSRYRRFCTPEQLNLLRDVILTAA